MGYERDGHRAVWREARRRMEADLAGRRRHTMRGPVAASALIGLTEAAARVLHWAQLAGPVARRAGNFVVERHAIGFADLPPALDGYAILHLSDLHVGNVPGLMARAGAALAEEQADLVVLTGDYQTQGLPSAPEAAAEIAQLLAPLRPTDGTVAVLGNHDSHAMAEALDGLGLRVLVNETVTVGRDGAAMHVVGVDDVHAFYTSAALAALGRRPPGFSIALVHTPELADVAAEAGHRLYLCGHTHGGQVCLPGGRPLLTALDSHRELASGRWRRGAMEGYTSRGLGSSRPPLRLNCPPEAAVLRLYRHPGFP